MPPYVFRDPPSVNSKRFLRRWYKIIGFGFLTLFSAEYLSQVWGVSFQLYYKDTPENRLIIESCRDIKKRVYKPTFYLPTATLQIIYGAKFDPIPYVPFEREHVPMPDKGEIALDWGPIHKSYEGRDPKKMRILLITHGLTGGSETNYIRHAVLNASRYGFRPVVYHNRGINSKLKTEKYHNHGAIDDIDHVLHHINKENPEATIYGLGISMGANLMSNYAGEKRNESLIKGFVSISNPYDLYECSKHISKWSNWLYNYQMTMGFIKNLQNNLEQLQVNKNIDIPAALKCTKTKDFDEFITRRLFGFHDLDDYYRAIGCLPKISNITVPALFIHSLDDPICE